MFFINNKYYYTNFTDIFDRRIRKCIKLDESEYCNLVKPDMDSIYKALYESNASFTINFVKNPRVAIDEIATLLIPRDRAMGITDEDPGDYEDIEKKPHFTIHLFDQDGSRGRDRDDRWVGIKDTWVLVELPRAYDGVKYVPVFIHPNSSGISIHPDFHKYFNRAFDKKERHVILGFIYVNANRIESLSNYTYDNHRPISKKDIGMLQPTAKWWTDDKAPKRIDFGPRPYSDDEYGQQIVDQYKYWLKNKR